MNKCDDIGEAVKNFREKYPKLDKRMKEMVKFDKIHEGIFTDKEGSATLDRWLRAVIEDNSEETYEKIDEELLMIKRGIKGKEMIKNLEKESPPGWKKGLLWDYLNCIDTGKTMSANNGGRRRRRSTKKKKKKRRKRNLKKRTKRRRRSKRRRRR
jgi:hypothetical protein